MGGGVAQEFLQPFAVVLCFTFLAIRCGEGRMPTAGGVCGLDLPPLSHMVWAPLRMGGAYGALPRMGGGYGVIPYGAPVSVPGPTLMEGSSWGYGAYAVGHMYGAPLRMGGANTP